MHNHSMPVFSDDPNRSDPSCPSPEDFLLELASLTEEAAHPKRVRPTAKRTRRALLAGVLLGMTGLSVAGAVVASTCTLCYAVSSNGTPLAYVQGQETYHMAVRQVETQVSEILQTDYAYPQKTQVSLAIAPREQIQNPDQLTSRLMETVDQVKEEYVLAVDGVEVAACDSREAIDQALWQVKADYTTGDTVAVYFGSSVDISLQYLPAQTEVLDAPSLKEKLTQTGQPPEEEPAVAVFAPETPPQEEPAPQPMAAPEETPPLDVRTVEEVTYTQPIPVPVQEEPDSTLLLGERKVIQEGAPGLEERTDRITRRCGEEQAREALSSKVLTEPTPTRVAVGTAQGVEGAQGRFVWPCMGQITSPFGPRHIFGSDSFHSGTDIAEGMGTPISAAADGTVVWAGTKGSYGSLVKVDHGNGFLTYYAHCSQLLVQEGDVVKQGQVIAEMGSTGRSTGPHCHFEIRWLDEPIDPQLCLP